MAEFKIIVTPWKRNISHHYRDKYDAHLLYLDVMEVLYAYGNNTLLLDTFGTRSGMNVRTQFDKCLSTNYVQVEQVIYPLNTRKRT